MKLEICIDSPESATIAQKTGADRIELCAGLLEGGTTPSAGMIKAVRRHAALGLMVLIRPRGGDFLYGDLEMEVMLEEVHTAKALGADGVVLGCLRSDGTIDTDKTSALIRAARPLPVTFHRAFDVCSDPFVAVEQIIELGIQRILTSGQEASALEGIDVIGAIREKAGSRVIIMAGGGITAHNVEKIVKASGVTEVHMTCAKTVESGMTHRNKRVSMAGALRPQEYACRVADEAGIRRVREALR